ncbi:MAG: UvrD-helicase domain-containing protein [Clostridia bacterium]|nr:UvrD-helicase domain-containing protein [Clostridia bacterium]
MTDFDLRYSALRREIIEREFGSLNPRQLEAVLSVNGPLLLAGAGSGKTTVLINRIINILRYGSACESELAPEWATEDDLRTLAEAVADADAVDDETLRRLCAVDAPRPYEVIAITFTNKAANELRERLNVACGEWAGDIWAHTFHSACTRILRANIEKLGYSRNFTIYDEDDRKKLVTAVLKDLNYDEKKYDVRGVISAISRAKDELMTPEEFMEMAGNDFYRRVVARVYEEYQRRMRAASALDFDDIICVTVELLQTCDEVREYYQRKFRYVLVDEYQDTNHAQYMLCSLLSGGYGNLCVVGDDDQSIYKFRGATIENIMEFEEQHPNAKLIRLEQNYRSCGNILDGANSVIANNLGRKGKTLWTQNERGAKIQLFVGETQEEEGQYIVSEIQRIYGKGGRLRDCAVLYRSHALSNSLENVFKRNTIPYRIVSGLRFFDRAEVKDMLAYLWLVNNPDDTVRLRRIINVPARKIGARTVDELSRIAQERGVSEFEVAARAAEEPSLSRSAAALTAFTDMISSLRELRENCSLLELYEHVLDKSGYLTMLLAQGGDEARARSENIAELKSNIQDYCARTQEPTLEGFLEEISLLTDIDRYDAEADAVTMMTMHSAKGLEFPHVFVCGAEEGIFPSFRSMESEAEIEEERRICYVAMTRAKQTLHITCARRRLLYGQTVYCKPSRFIGEIAQEFIEEAVTRTPAYTPRREARTETGASRPQRPTARRPDVSVSQPVASSARVRFAKGERIRHKAFGDGTVREVTPMGGDLLLEIVFDRVGQKLMMAKTAQQFIEKI